MVAERFCIGAAPCTATPTLEYFILDHLGSISVITDVTGIVLQRLSYDAWGKRRNVNGGAADCGTITSSATRGFTGQEMMDSVCYVNFNARIYDPSLGRFLSADPMTATVYDLQALNRYSYVFNNPLSLTDPSGLCFLGCFWKQSWFAAVLDVAIFFIAPELEGLSLFGATGLLAEAAAFNIEAIGVLAINGGIAGGLSAAVAGGNVLRGALMGALQAAATFGLGGYLGGANALGAIMSPTAAGFLAQGSVGGLLSIAQGGSFASGFLAGGVGSLGGHFSNGQFDLGKLVVSATLGGAAAVLGGGKFANGAITGAFAYAAATCAAGGCEESLARSNDPLKGPEIPEAEREKIIGDAIATFHSQPGASPFSIIINDADTYAIADETGIQWDYYDTLAGMNAGIAAHEAASGDLWGYVSGWSNGFMSIIYASAAYPQSDIYGLPINPATSTLFAVWHENGHQGWPFGGNCLGAQEACANQWAQSHVNGQVGH